MYMKILLFFYLYFSQCRLIFQWPKNQFCSSFVCKLFWSFSRFYFNWKTQFIILGFSQKERDNYIFFRMLCLFLSFNDELKAVFSPPNVEYSEALKCKLAGECLFLNLIEFLLCILFGHCVKSSFHSQLEWGFEPVPWRSRHLIPFP